MRYFGLYAIADYDTCLARALDPSLVALAMCAAGVPLVQLRAKSLADEAYLGWIESAAAGRTGPSLLVINDRADLAVISGVGGVHVGQEDLPLEQVRGLSRGLFVGLSTHNLGQLEAALLVAPDYVAFGPIFPTRSKKNADPDTGLELLAEAHSLCRERGIPLVAIGGITDERLTRVAAHCDMVAGIGMLMPPSSEDNPYHWITRRCQQLHESILACG